MKYFHTLLFLLSYSLPSFCIAAKAVCVAKNNQTNQTFQVVIGKASYSAAERESQKRVLSQCAQTTRPENCFITACYQR